MPGSGAAKAGRPEHAGRRWRWWHVAVAIFVVFAAFLGYAYAETFRIEVERITYASPDVPPAFDGKRIVLLTDIHRGPFFSQARVGRLVDRVNALSPDIVVLGGDYVLANIDYEKSCFTELAALKAPLGRFAVLGNHDYGDYPSVTVEAIDNSGITLLRDQAVWVGAGSDRVRIGGVSDFQVDQPRVGPVVEGVTKQDLLILISHNPDYAEELAVAADTTEAARTVRDSREGAPEDPGVVAAAAEKVDLILSGHTHGGQVTFFGLWAPHLPSDYGQKYRTGIVHNGTTTVVVSNGIGTIFPPLRFFARPQIVEITLRSAPAGGVQDAAVANRP